MAKGNGGFFRDPTWTFIGVVVAVMFGIAGIIAAIYGKTSNNIINVNPQPTVPIIQQGTPVSTSIIPTSTPTLVPTDTSIPTQTLSASQILTGAATAIGIDANENPTAYTSDFRVGQRVYLTFQIHTSGQEGYLTTEWFANNQYIFRGSNYPIISTSTRGYSSYIYSYATYGAARLYWCTKPDCSDGQLAATVTFNVYA